MAGLQGHAGVETTERPTSTDAPPIADPRAARWFSIGICTGAVAGGVGLLTIGDAPLPAPGPVLLLGLAAALCVNRFALFSTEHASTAEAAVIVAAVVGFRDN